MTTFAYPVASRPMMLRLSTAAELMTPNPLSFDTNMPIQKANALLTLHELDAAPLVDRAGRLVGVVTSAACAAWEEFTLRASPADTVQELLDWSSVVEIASPAGETIPHDAPSRDVIERLVRSRARRIYVVGEWDELVGVVSMSDVLRHLSEHRGQHRGQWRADPAHWC